MTAPVKATLMNPSASGSVAAASEPKTPSRISSTIGKPVFSADSRSSLERSCMPAQSGGLADEVGLDPGTGALAHSELLTKVDRQVGDLVLPALDVEGGDGHRGAAGVALGGGLGAVAQLGVVEPRGHAVHPVDLGPHGRGVGAGALGQDDGEGLPLGTLEVLERPVHRL